MEQEVPASVVVLNLLQKYNYVPLRRRDLGICRSLREGLLRRVNPDRLDTRQLQCIGQHRALFGFLRRENALFGVNAKARVRQWTHTACDCGRSAEKCPGPEEDEEEEEDTQLCIADARLLDPREDILAYKIVYFCRHPDGRGKLDGVCALLHLQLPGASAHIYTSDGTSKGDVVKVQPPREGLHATQKYNTNAAVVTGVQFFGAPRPTKQTLLAFQQNHGFLVSGFGGANKMRYELGRLHVEPRAGQVISGKRCTAGLHFFVDPASAFQYGRGEWTKHSAFLGVVTLRLSKPRGLVFAIEDEAPVSSPRDLHLNTHQKLMSRAAPLERPMHDPSRSSALQKYLLQLADDARDAAKRQKV